MGQQRKEEQGHFNTNKGLEGEAFDNDEKDKGSSGGGKNKKEGPQETGSHDEGQYQEGNDKPTMSPGSSEAEVNPSASKK